MSKVPVLFMGASCPVANPDQRETLLLPTHHLVTHAVVVGATGSGKTGNVLVMVEEALRCGVPTLMIDVKGDLPNLLLAFPEATAEMLEPWVEGAGAAADGRSARERAAELAVEHREGLARWGIGPAQVAEYVAKRSVRVITP